jgi:uncharacterized repeat protein (TIGR03803 family)
MNVGKLSLAKRKTICALFLLCAAAIPSSAQTFTTLLLFDGANGELPFSMVQGFDGNFYGTTQNGGAVGYGTVFKITPQGVLTTLYSFCNQDACVHGNLPQTGLALGADGNFYGTTFGGGGAGCDCGTIFRITPSGTLTTLHAFQQTDGAFPFSGLTQASNGFFYGTVFGGGAHGVGTVIKMNAAGKVTTLYSFCSQPGCTDGADPFGNLIEGTDGNLYGTTEQGGASGLGTIFQITPAGAFKTLYSFRGADGLFPTAGVAQAAGAIYGYGMTSRGGKHGEGDYDSGTVFRSDRAGNLTLLHSFCLANCADGSDPYGGLIQGTDGNFYGTTQMGGFPVCSSSDLGCGTVFKITPTGVFTTLHTFCTEANCVDGSSSYAGLVQGTDGTFYGTTAGGGTQNQGTVFSLDVGLAPFVESVPGSGKVGANTTILGNDLTGTTAVTFNGTAAAFTVVSGTQITATVPAGAASGTVAVTTPNGTLTSNVPFQILR